MSGSAPLAGRVVLLLRPEDRAVELARRLRSLGARPIHAPVIAFVPPRDESAARDAILALERYDLVVFTSATGARAFVDRTQAFRSGFPLAAVHAAAVGPKTAGALREAGIEPVLVSTAGLAEGLRAEVERRAPPAKTILVVRPEGGGGSGSFAALRERGARVDEVAFYRTIAADEAARAASLLVSGSVDAVVFTSGSTFRFLVEAGTAAGLDCAAALRRARRVAIGPVTAAALAAAGFGAHAVAVEATPESMCDAVLRALLSDPPVW